MAIAMPDELQESEGAGTNRALRAVCGSSASFLQTLDLQERVGPWPNGLQDNEKVGDIAIWQNLRLF